MPIELELGEPTTARAAGSPTPRRKGRTCGRERMSFTERLALLIETGVPLHAALDTLRAQTSNDSMRETIAALRTSVLEGKLLSQAMANHPEVFPASYVSLVAAGERGGFVAEVLKQLIDLDDKAQRLRATLISAVSYPAFLTIFSVVIVGIVLVFVFPRFGDLFAGLGDRLPATTALLMTASHVLRTYWLWILAALVAASAGLVHLLERPASRATFDRLLLRVPGIRTLAVEVYLLQFLRVLSLSLANGVSVVDALAASRDVVANRVFRKLLTDVEQRVSEGQPVAPGFEAAAFIPPLTKQMLATAEQSGRLALVTAKLAELYQREVERRLAIAARLAEPVLLALMGGIIGLIVSAVLLPVFRLSGAVH